MRTILMGLGKTRNHKTVGFGPIMRLWQHTNVFKGGNTRWEGIPRI